MTTNENFDYIQNEITNNDIVLFIKGTTDFPECGFSNVVVSIFKKLGVPFKGINILTSPALRQAIKDFSNWPTIPQIYIKGEFIGGCDIIKEMYDTNELTALLQAKNILSQ
ncbi:Grx4 family monothiol glutaredoxin [Candidatus Trichorickettsia mobilis]|nr:Grx4 family monothiol glutaredoxin [Candidatus Trichorickettsia mobilis]